MSDSGIPEMTSLITRYVPWKMEDFEINKENDLFLLVDGHFRLQVEHSYARRYSSGKNDLYQTELQTTNKKSPTSAPAESTIIRRLVEEARNGSCAAKQNSSKLQVKELNSPLGAEKKGGNSQQQTSQEIAKSSTSIENVPLREGLQPSSSILICDDMSPRRREAHARKRAIDNQPVACRSRAAESATILRDKFNQVKILGNAQASHLTFPHQTPQETAKSFDQIENMPLYKRLQRGRNSPIIISDDDTSPRIGSRKFRRSTHANKRVINDQIVACCSRTAESTTIPRDKLDQVKILGNNRASRLTSSDSENSDTPFTRIGTTKPAKNDALIRDNDTESEDESRPSSSKRPLSWMERRIMVQEERKGGRRPTRNFARWEQCEMINYLIKNNAIGDAKGNLVWQRMLKDGFLRHRTYQSLHNHFRKFILPQIHRFPLTPKCIKKFHQLR